MTNPAKITSWPLVTGIDVSASHRGRSIVALGDSITDGAASTADTNQRWPDLLATRLQANASTDDVAVLNEGIIGNRLLAPAPPGRPFLGPAALARLDRDVFSQANVAYLIVALGINDIGFSDPNATSPDHVDAADIIAGYQQIIEQAHEHGIDVIGATITPFENAQSGPDFYTLGKDRIRRAVNHWTGTSGSFDGVVDFDSALRDPTHPGRVLPAFDSGDHLHPNDLGHRAMAHAVNLKLFH